MTLGASDVLSKGAAELFPGDHDAVRAEFRRLAAIWHPDKGGDVAVMAHLVEKRDVALGRTPPPTASLRVAKTKKLLQFPYFEHRLFEAGEIYVTASAVVYHVKSDYADLAERASRVRFTFRDKKMADSLAPLLPNLVRDVQLEDGRAMIYRREKDQVLLSDLLEKMGATYVSGPHGMWILSGLMNLSAYMWISGYTHYGMLPHNILVCPPLHTVAVTGPPMYLQEHHARVDAVPPEVLSMIPQLRARKDVSLIADGLIIRNVVRRMMGIHDLANLRARRDLHDGFREFLLTSPAKNALEDYRLWEKLRGKTRFTPMELDARKLYAAD